MDAKLKEEKEQRLSTILGTMDIPLARKIRLDLWWLSRNMGIRNSKHKNYGEAIALVTELLREQIK